MQTGDFRYRIRLFNQVDRGEKKETSGNQPSLGHRVGRIKKKQAPNWLSEEEHWAFPGY